MRERNVIINIRVTDKEKKALERSAKRAGLSLSAFLRKAGLNERIFVKPSASLFKAYEATEWVTFDNKYMRHDIGKAIDEA